MNALDPIPVYVPVTAPLKAVIDAGAAIVGSPTPDWMRTRAARIREANPQLESKAADSEAAADVLDQTDINTLVIDYEGNRYGASNIVTFADRCLHAHGRHVEHYPTHARSQVNVEDVEQVALYYPDRRLVEVPGGLGLPRLAEWLGLMVNRGQGVVIDRHPLSQQLRGTGR